MATDANESIDWNVTISDTDCSMQPESMFENTSSGWTIVDQYGWTIERGRSTSMRANADPELVRQRLRQLGGAR